MSSAMALSSEAIQPKVSISLFVADAKLIICSSRYKQGDVDLLERAQW